MDLRRRPQDWRHVLALCLITAVISGGLSYLFLRIDLIPGNASAERVLIDNFVKILLAIAGFFFGIIATVLVYALIFFRRQAGDNTDATPITGNPPLEFVWTAVPLVIVVVLGIYGAVILDKMTATDPANTTTQSIFSLGATVPRSVAASPGTPAPELVVNVTAARFIWKFDYPDYGISSYVLEVPVDQRIRFNLQSLDVIHSFWVQQWGPKQDAVPGLTTELQITPTVIGQFLVQCSQLCGYGHTGMTAPVRVVSASDFNVWVKQQSSSSSAAPLPGANVSINLTARNQTFDKNTITVSSGAEISISFSNLDNNVPHNFAVYTDASAAKPIFVGAVITGPKTITYTFAAPATPGKYFFRCDVHPLTMIGTFEVQ